MLVRLHITFRQGIASKPDKESSDDCTVMFIDAVGNHSRIRPDARVVANCVDKHDGAIVRTLLVGL